MTRLAFLDELARRKLDVIKVDFDELEAELRQLVEAGLYLSPPVVERAPRLVNE